MTEEKDELLEAIKAVKKARITGDHKKIDESMGLLKELVTREENPLKVEVHHLVEASENCKTALVSYPPDAIKNILFQANPLEKTLLSLKTIEDAKVQIADKKEPGLSTDEQPSSIAKAGKITSPPSNKKEARL